MASYIVNINLHNGEAEEAFKETKKFLDVQPLMIHVISELRYVKTSNFGFRFVATFDDEFEVFMPPRFKAEHEAKRTR